MRSPDVTNPKQSAETPSLDEWRFRALVNASTEVIWQCDLRGQLVCDSPSWRQFTGQSEDDISAGRWADAIHPEDRIRVTDVVSRGIAQQAPWQVEERLRRFDGEWRHMVVHGIPIRDAEGAIREWVGSCHDVTEIKRAQELLAQSQERYALVEAAVNDGIYDHNLLTDESYLSPRWKEILGYADHEVPNLESAFRDLVHPDDRAAIAEVTSQYLRSKAYKSHTLDFRLRHKNGDYRWVHSRGMALFDATNRPIRVLGTITDITDRKQAEEALRRSEERYRLAESAVNDGLWDLDLVTGSLYLSPRWKEILGYADHELANIPSVVVDLLHPDDRRAVIEARRSHLQENRPYALDYRMRGKNGDYRWVHSRGTSMYDAANRPVRILGAITDITDRKRAEEELARTNQELIEKQYAVDQAVIVDITDVKGDIICANDKFCQISGYAREELLGANHRILKSETHSAAFFREMFRQIANGKVWRGELCNRAKGGSLYWVDTTIIPQLGPDGKPDTYMAIRIDITARKETEAALSQEMRQRDEAQKALVQINQHLELRVAERTAELKKEMHQREKAQITLAQVQKMEAIGQLTAGIAHDFNNLLAVITGGLEIVEKAAARGLPAEPELINAAARAARRGSELVQRLLAFARKSTLKAEPVMLDQLVLDTLRMLQRMLGEDISIVTHLNATAAAVHVDRSLLANALVNLALNARDAMPEGGELTIVTTCQASRWAANEGASRWPTGEEVCMTVRDTGVGMTEEVRNHAFEPFFTTKKDGLGSGLGLSMVQGFVEQSGGHIEIESEVGTGTSITIHLPKVNMASQPADGGDVAGSSATGKEKTVLLVEDDSDVRVVIAAQLKQLGYKVHAVANGNEAIDLIESPAKIDITLTDIVLPGGIDGVTLMKNAMQVRPNMGVLCMSGYDPTQKNRKWFQIQNIAFLEKPFSSTRLAQALISMLAE